MCVGVGGSLCLSSACVSETKELVGMYYGMGGCLL